MLSKADVKFIKSLQVKKYRKQEQCFVVEGAKSVLELLGSDFEVDRVVCTEKFAVEMPARQVHLQIASESALSALGEFQTNTIALAIARMKPNTPVEVKTSAFAIALDDIKDPGNLGTIIRTADWYGINTIIASTETADFYNPKTISATMGSFTRVRIYYTSLPDYLQRAKVPVFGAYLDGADVHTVDFGRGGIIVIGSESHGISEETGKVVTKKITIPRYGGAESLNAAIATAIICDNIKRRS